MLVGLSGFKGVGKSVVGSILVQDFEFTLLSFADHLKNVTALLFDWPRELLEGNTDESRTWREEPDDFWSREFGRLFSPREALQKLGTESVRDIFHWDFWIIALKKRLQTPGNYVITDVRFPNEIDFVTDQGGFNVRVRRGDDPVWLSAAQNEIRELVLEDRPIVPACLAVEFPEAHYSEWASLARPTSVNYIIDNTDTIDALKANVSTMLKLFRGS